MGKKTAKPTRPHNVEFKEYPAWSKMRIAEEPRLWYFEFLWWNLVPVCLWQCYELAQVFTLQQWAVFTVFICFNECIGFVNGHIAVHSMALQNHIDDERKHFAFAFYHHYEKRGLSCYDRFPLVYYASYFVFLAPMFVSFAYWDVSKYTVFLFSLVTLFDLAAHQYYHSRPNTYTWNPFKLRNKYVYFFMRVCDRIGLLSIEQHRLEHHGHFWTNRTEVEDWVDLKFPIIKYIGDAYGHFWYSIIKKLSWDPSGKKNYAWVYVIRVWYFVMAAAHGYFMKKCEPYLFPEGSAPMNNIEAGIWGLYVFFYVYGVYARGDLVSNNIR